MGMVTFCRCGCATTKGEWKVSQRDDRIMVPQLMDERKGRSIASTPKA